MQQKITLRALCNRSVHVAQSDFFYQRDDDDLHHPHRLEAQWSALAGEGFDDVYMQEALQFFPPARQMFPTNWRATEAACHPGTPIHYAEEGTTANLDEDLAVALQLKGCGRVQYLRDAPHLFVYVSQGSKTMPCFRGGCRFLGRSCFVARARSSAA